MSQFAVEGSLSGAYSQLRNLAAQAPVMDAAANGLNALSGAISGLNDSGAGAAIGAGIKNNVEDMVRMAEDWTAMFQRVNRAFERLKSDPLGMLPKSENVRNRGGGANAQWPTSASAVPWVTGEPNTTYTPATGSGSYWSPGSSRLGTRKSFNPPNFPAPGVSDTMKFGTGVDGDRGPLTVNGEVHGEITGRFEVTAGSELLRVVESVKMLSAQVRG